MKNIMIKHFNEIELRQFQNALEDYTVAMEYETSFKYGIALRNEALFKVMYYCALRVSETTLLKCSSFNKLRNELYCERLKGGQSNTLQILDVSTRKALDKHIKYNKPSKYLFETLKPKNSRLSRKTLHYWMKYYCTLACLYNEKLHHCHTLRHTRAVNLANSSLDIHEIQYWLGHTDITSTQIYLHFTTQQRVNMYRKLKKHINKKGKRHE